ncbi:MAG: hypothetical protein GY716_22035 [bacterium]|nr:hypothetical protein [bacterium]
MTRTAVVRWLIGLAVVDGLLLVVNAASLLAGREIPALLCLDQEASLPTWYSSAKLLAVALAAVGCQRSAAAELRRGLRGLVWPGVALLFGLLALDESFSLHERLAALLMSGELGAAVRLRVLGGDGAKDAFAWPVLFAPFVVALLWFLATTLYSRLRTDRRNLVLGLLGCVAYLGAVVLEGGAVFASPPIDAWGDAELTRYFYFVLFEEGLELLGTTAMLAALALHATRSRCDSR